MPLDFDIYIYIWNGGTVDRNPRRRLDICESTFQACDVDTGAVPRRDQGVLVQSLRAEAQRLRSLFSIFSE